MRPVAYLRLFFRKHERKKIFNRYTVRTLVSTYNIAFSGIILLTTTHIKHTTNLNRWLIKTILEHIVCVQFLIIKLKIINKILIQ